VVKAIIRISPEKMSNRRTFLKHAGVLGVASWPEALPADQHTPGQQPAGGGTVSRPETPGIILENAEMRLVISPAGVARSLIHKATGKNAS